MNSDTEEEWTEHVCFPSRWLTKATSDFYRPRFECVAEHCNPNHCTVIALSTTHANLNEECGITACDYCRYILRYFQHFMTGHVNGRCTFIEYGGDYLMANAYQRLIDSMYDKFI